MNPLVDSINLESELCNTIKGYYMLIISDLYNSLLSERALGDIDHFRRYFLSLYTSVHMARLQPETPIAVNRTDHAFVNAYIDKRSNVPHIKHLYDETIGKYKEYFTQAYDHIFDDTLEDFFNFEEALILLNVPFESASNKRPLVDNLLSEFHNAMCHLIRAMYMQMLIYSAEHAGVSKVPEWQTVRDSNRKRALNHLIRGSKDVYKLIIKVAMQTLLKNGQHEHLHSYMAARRNELLCVGNTDLLKNDIEHFKNVATQMTQTIMDNPKLQEEYISRHQRIDSE